jgi:hypothetical protein
MELSRHAFGIRGAHASIKWGYHVAAQLGAWTFAGSGVDGGQVSATVVSRDAFRLSQSPLTLVLVLHSVDPVTQKVTGTTPVKWPVRGMADHGETVMVMVGPCERT